jgi:broad specificity polyphosphatase/5'/3'-nucleotidase SurE
MSGAGAHVHTFSEYPNTTFYMPNSEMNHATATAPTDIALFGYRAQYFSIDAVYSGDNISTNTGTFDKVLYR